MSRTTPQLVREPADPSAPDPTRVLPARPSVCGKSLFRDGEKLPLRGVTYGPLAHEWEPAVVAADFEQMRAHGINAVRVYEVPPRWLLDLAAAHELGVLAGVPWEQHVAFLDRRRAQAIERRVASAVASVAGHPALLCWALGNEISPSIVRWHGRRRVESFLARLARAARREDPTALLTYVSYPSTEYLRVPWADVVAFNVYLERRADLEAYLARLQNLADDRPLLLAEVGLDSRRNGEAAQAESLAWQIDAIADAGCAGCFVFSWTDEWSRGGAEILDWDFGLTTRAREPKPALAAVAAAFARVPPPPPDPAPNASVVVCTHNGAATLGAALEGVLRMSHRPDELIVVSDGSTDASAEIARRHGAQLIEIPHAGLSAARNVGLAAATGEIVAFLDDDARPDPDWLLHLARAFAHNPGWVAVGGPNVLPPDSGAVAECVANAPGGPTHVLLSDREAEHLPGCNLAVRAAALRDAGGFDPRFRSAGDDVDVCWRLLERGHRLGFSPGAVVWHHRRDTVRGYLRQQRGYGRAEALLEAKWPDRYSAGGHVDWAGRLYGNGSAQLRGGWRWRVYYGGWGTGFFQSLYGPRRGVLESLPLMPEWWMAIAALALLSAASVWWTPLLAALPLLVVALAALGFDAAVGAARARFASGRPTGRLRALTATLYLLQPLARLQGRLMSGLTPWRRRGPSRAGLPFSRSLAFWSEHWGSTEERVASVRAAIRAEGAVVGSGGPWDAWDLEVRGGTLGTTRLTLAIEEHGGGRQVVRVATRPYVTRGGRIALSCAILLTLAALLTQHRAALLVAALALALVLRLAYECGLASAAARRALRELRPGGLDLELEERR